MKKIVKGNEAIVIGALVAECDAFFGYPITPASEIAQKASEYFPKLGKIFLQAESEISAINMVFGASSAGLRVLTASSGPGISLKCEGISYLAGAELPAVIADIMRAGPGLGNIGPEQADYFQITKGGGHGSYKLITLAPNSVKEMYEFTIKAFELADKYKNPAVILTDAVVGQMMEPIEIKPIEIHKPEKKWILDDTPFTNDNLITSIYLDFNDMEKHVRKLEEKYKLIEENEQDAELYMCEDAEVIVTGYGIVSRILKSIVYDLRKKGIKIGLIRPKTLFPFPVNYLRKAMENTDRILVVELSTGQFLEDVKKALPDKEIFFYSRVGGNTPDKQEIVKKMIEIVK